MAETIVITGANRGIGLALVQQYAETGARIFAACRHPEKAPELSRLAARTQGRVSVHPLDVTQPAQVAALAGVLTDTPVDILINNAGSYGPATPFGQTDEAAWVETLRINTIAPLKIMEALVDRVAASERRLMVNITSKMGSMGDNGSGGAYIYRSTKAALNAVVVSAARDLQARKITVVAQHPGWVRTDMGGPNGELDTTESATALRHIFARLTLADSGRFIDIDGSDIPW
ncbi:Short-chain dehydrogenase [Ectothiorhodospira magna]|uniref:Short-chain dehydrogenase n=1 Tax=Ectothiorhodospira magna TaxID=867345 RepID=A0A1H9BQ06_9GAMM|nr:SDR family oxidoreductase [Ectothiorhodospira magna]SEP90969.1 Short-chain dehydrogenase [Ectothiorhodospira magna]